MNNISVENLMQSLDVKKNIKMIFKAGESAGKSGSFFFFSHDHKFVIKTLKGNEKQLLINILDDYIEHFKKNDNKSLMARIFGIFEI
jgi:1-phosphatidylinositol-4-phosphate 5-kinase